MSRVYPHTTFVIQIFITQSAFPIQRSPTSLALPSEYGPRVK